MHKILDSKENYLETIYRISLEANEVRSIDIAKFLNLAKPSVSRAVKNLHNEKLIIIKDNGALVFTPEGKNIAENIYKRHIFLRDFFCSIGVEYNQADEDACKIEHVISDESFNKLQRYFANNSKK